MKRVMPFVQATREKVDQYGLKALALTLEFDETEVLRKNSIYLANTLDVRNKYLFDFILIMTLIFVCYRWTRLLLNTRMILKPLRK